MTSFVEITHPSHIYSSQSLKAVFWRRKKEWTELRMMVYGRLYEQGRIAETEVGRSFPKSSGQYTVDLKYLSTYMCMVTLREI